MGKRGPKPGHGGRPIIHTDSVYHILLRAQVAASKKRKREASKK